MKSEKYPRPLSLNFVVFFVIFNVLLTDRHFDVPFSFAQKARVGKCELRCDQINNMSVEWPRVQQIY